MIWLSILGMVLLTGAGIPQILKAFKDGHAEGLAKGMVLCWTLGLACMTYYIVECHPEDLVLAANYGINLIISIILLRFKFFPRKVSKV